MRKTLSTLSVIGLLLAATGSARSGHELWKTKLAGEGGILTFDRAGSGIWIRQQGVVFLSPERLVAVVDGDTVKVFQAN